MKRFCFLVVLTLLSSSAHAGSLSFSVGGHRIHVDSSRHCRSASCASVSISGLSRSIRSRGDADRDTIDTATSGMPAAIAPAPALASPPQVQPSLAPPPVVYRPAAVTTQPVAAPAPPAQPATVEVPAPPPPAAVAAPPAPPLPPPPVVEAVRPAPRQQVSPASREVDDDPWAVPVGDWQTEARGMVRIVKCGRALCGYVLNASGEERGEAVLVNMKPTSDRRWTGSIYSQDSGDSYYGTMELKGTNGLRIEACALGRFYCSGNNWTRIGGERLMTSNRIVRAQRS